MMTNQRNSQQSLGKLFGSIDSTVEFFRSKDLAVIFSSADRPSSVAPPQQAQSDPKDCFRSIDHVASLMSMTNRSISQTYISKLMESKDSIFASIDPLPFHSVDSVLSTPGKANEGETTRDAAPWANGLAIPGIFESREWLRGYERDHKDIPITASVFQSTEIPMPPLNGEASSKSRVSSSTNWMEMYYNSLCNPLEWAPETESTIPERATVEPKKSADTVKRVCKTRRSEPKVKVYVEPTPLDILCGRGGKSNRWKGNERYRQIIDDTKPVYNESAKYEKTLLSQKVVEEMKKEGRRFLKLDNSNSKWYIVPDLMARRKAGQALREENTPEARMAKRERYQKKDD